MISARLILAGFAALQMIPFAPPPMPSDPRIQLVPYSPDQVTSLRVAMGYAAVVEFAPDERIENVVVGNPDGWQVTANKAGDRLVVKPLSGAASTNMVVLTDSRRYVLLLENEGGGIGAFVLRFRYPPSTAAGMIATKQAATYSLKGNKKLFPVTMEDDGRQTSITWDQATALPAIFVVENGREALVNGRMVGGDYVLPSIAARYVFRRGRDKATATRRLRKPER